MHLVSLRLGFWRHHWSHHKMCPCDQPAESPKTLKLKGFFWAETAHLLLGFAAPVWPGAGKDTGASGLHGCSFLPLPLLGLALAMSPNHYWSCDSFWRITKRNAL